MQEMGLQGHGTVFDFDDYSNLDSYLGVDAYVEKMTAQGEAIMQAREDSKSIQDCERHLRSERMLAW